MNTQIQKELLAIKGEKELLLVDEVIDWARRHKRSALHAAYEWNQKRAALEHWRETTRRLIALHITFADGERKFVSLSIDRTRPGGGYRDLNDVLQAPSLHEILLDDALRELNRMKNKYERVSALKPVWEEAEKIRTTRKKAA